MSVLSALLAVGALVVAAVTAGLVLRARSGRRTAARVGDVALADLGLAQFGAEGTVVQFSTEFCARCPQVGRALRALAADDEGIAFADVDLTHRTDLATRYRVLQTPTVLVLDADGVARARFAGAVTPAAVRTELDLLKGGDRVFVP